MKNKTIKLILVWLLVSTISSCSKNACRTCILEDRPQIRVEVCPDKLTSYDGNNIIAVNKTTMVVSLSVISLESSGYKCN